MTLEEQSDLAETTIGGRAGFSGVVKTSTELGLPRSRFGTLSFCHADAKTTP